MNLSKVWKRLHDACNMCLRFLITFDVFQRHSPAAIHDSVQQFFLYSTCYLSSKSCPKHARPGPFTLSPPYPVEHPSSHRLSLQNHHDLHHVIRLTGQCKQPAWCGCNGSLTPGLGSYEFLFPVTFFPVFNTAVDTLELHLRINSQRQPS